MKDVSWAMCAAAAVFAWDLLITIIPASSPFTVFGSAALGVAIYASLACVRQPQ